MRPFLPVLLSAVAAVVAGACGSDDATFVPISGASGTSSGTSGTGGGGNCTAELASIAQAIFAPSCTASTCHNATDTAGDLDLASPGLEARLVDVPAATCKALRVAPGKPEASFLYAKVSAASPACGDRMPIGAALTAAEQACIHDWIASLSGGCETCGGSACVDLTTDSSHCGACDHACNAGTSCKASACACDNGGLDCNGVCTPTDADPKNCGGCGKACKAGEVCLAGSCSSSGCGALTQCGSACVDTKVDAANCGACGKACGAKETCTGSKCVCPGAGDLMTDSANCGACGLACKQGETCASGKCVCGNATVAFAAAVQPIFTANCATAMCHAGVASKAGLDLSKGKSFGGLVNVKAGQCNDGRLRVKPNDPAQSYLIDKVMNVDLCSGTSMPKNSSLSASETQTLVNWICGGALNN